jgi:DNA mismatch repair protein MutS2
MERIEMDNRALKVLEYDKIIQMLQDRTVSSLGRYIAEKLKPSADFDKVRERLKETSDASVFLWRKGSPPFGGIHDIRPSLKRVEIGSMLGIPELLAVGDVLRCGRIIKKYLTENIPDDSKDNSVFELGNQISVFKHVEDAISNTIKNEEELFDHASSELFSIRKNIRRKQDSIKEKLSSLIHSPQYKNILQDAVVTIRADRYVIPVKQEYKSQVQGLVHDMSASGATVFIEPISVVEANNEIKTLQLKEQQEIERILRMLTSKVSEIREELSLNLKILAKLDFMFAKARLSMDFNSVCPELTNSRIIKIKQGRHPLLDKNKVVPIDIELGKDFTTLVITGPNTGGKTVTLKTVGLFVLMLQSGLHIPVREGSQFGIFNSVYADIGDEQSIEQSLSTFSSHMKNIVRILDKADEGTLVLLDELGAGTDPTEGAALAISILEGLTKRNICTMATTHYSELKIYAMTTRNVQNACCEFDVETLRPTYKLLIGLPGKSNAFAISQKLGLKREVIHKAKEFLTRDNIRFENVLSELEEKRIQTEKEKESAMALRKEIESLRIEAQKNKDKIIAQKDKIISKAKEEARSIIINARYEAQQLIDELKELKNGLDAVNYEKEIHQAKARLRKLDDMEETLVESYNLQGYLEPPKNLKPGESVFVLNLNQQATVLEPPDSDHEVLVLVGIMKVKVHESQLKRIDEQKEVLDKINIVRVSDVKSSNIKPELDLKGLNVEEAIDKVDKYIDDAVLAGLNEVTIIHGKGTGTLRKAIHVHLKGHSNVGSYRLGKYGEGETGVTIVEIKP